MFLETDVQPPLVKPTRPLFEASVFSAVNPPGLQILRIDREGVIEQNTRWLQLSWICDVLPDWFTSHQSYYWVYCKGIIYHTGVYEETFDVNGEIQNVAQTMENIEKFTSVIIREISYSNLETREIRSKLWSVLDYPGDLTTLSFTFFFFSIKKCVQYRTWVETWVETMRTIISNLTCWNHNL